MIKLREFTQDEVERVIDEHVRRLRRIEQRVNLNPLVGGGSSNVVYGTGTPPDPSTLPSGTLFIVYVP